VGKYDYIKLIADLESCALDMPNLEISLMIACIISPLRS